MRIIARTMPAPRIIVRVDISPKAAGRLSSICQRFGCTHLTMFSRLVEWYSHLPEQVQSKIIGLSANPSQSSRAVLQHMLQSKE
jgi:hypothetical protein